MKYLNVFLFTLYSLLMAGCNDDEKDVLKASYDDKVIDMVHPNERDRPYPKEENVLFLNPAPLIVPVAARNTTDFLEFELSQDKTFPEARTLRSGKLAWNMYNCHEQLAVGEWYWRYRKIDAKDKADEWSDVYKFNVTGKEDVFVTPKFSEFQQNIPNTYPRIHCYLEEDLRESRPTLMKHREYKDLMNRVKNAMAYTASTADLYKESDTNTLKTNTFDYLYSVFLLTGDLQYQDKMLEYGRNILTHPINLQKTHSSGFHAANVVNSLSTIYDACQDRLTETEKTEIENVLLFLVTKYYDSYRGKLENHIFDNHAWQVVLRAMLQGSFVICQKYPQIEKALEYFYELWTARAPASGFNRSGAWQNGINYFGTNCYTLYYIPMLFSHLTKTNFLEHPWYRNAGKATAYSWLPDSRNCSFGDGTEKWEKPGRVQIGFMDFLAREMNDPYAAWLAESCDVTLKTDYSLRLYRMAQGNSAYKVPRPDADDFENYIWHQDIGEGIAHSGMLNSRSNLSLAFRSSPFGSGSHTLADQNGFKLLYKGEYIYMNAGYYQSFSDRHNLLQYRHTRGHNTIMVNNIGQPFTTRAYGNIERGLNGTNLAYFLGNASHAYCGISEYPMWQENFEKAGIGQTPEYGFGQTSLNRYKRHIFLLRPNKVVIYDDLGADEASTWQWLLHSPVEFQLTGNKAVTMYESKGGFTAVAQIYSEQPFDITQTNEWFPGAEPDKPADVAKQWHLTANFEPCLNNKILTVIQVSDKGLAEKIRQANDGLVIDEWTIKAELAADKPAAIMITNQVTGTVFSYGDAELKIDGVFYQRKLEDSSVLYDDVHGVMQIQESADKPLQTTRTAL